MNRLLLLPDFFFCCDNIPELVATTESAAAASIPLEKPTGGECVDILLFETGASNGSARKEGGEGKDKLEIFHPITRGSFFCFSGEYNLNLYIILFLAARITIITSTW